MKKIIRKIAEKIGIVTNYQVTAFFPNKLGGGVYLSLTLGMSPWLHIENHNDLTQYLQAKAETQDVKPNILNITKLGI